MLAPSMFAGFKRSLFASSGTIVFGMEDGTVSIFGLVFGVAATTSNSAAVLVAGASGAAAAAVSMMAGAYLEAETSRDGRRAGRVRPKADPSLDLVILRSSLSARLTAAGIAAAPAASLLDAIAHNAALREGLRAVLQPSDTAATAANPKVQASWMLLADFFSAAIPILPFALLPVGQARIISAAVTLALLVLLGLGRARIGNRGAARTVAETVAIGIAAASAGVGIGMLIDHLCK